MQSLQGSYKILVENVYPCKILQGNIFLAKSYKETSSSHYLTRKFIPCKILERFLHVIAFSYKILERLVRQCHEKTLEEPQLRDCYDLYRGCPVKTDKKSDAVRFGFCFFNHGLGCYWPSDIGR